MLKEVSTGREKGNEESKGEYGQCTLYTFMNIMLQLVEVFLRQQGEEWNNGRNEHNQGMLYACIEMSQHDPLCNIIH
jgi:hypothetical protein